MNIGEADDTIMLLRWLTSDQANEALTEKAKAAAARLADRSRRRIMAGIGGEEVLANWPAYAESEMWAQCRCLVRQCTVHGQPHG